MAELESQAAAVNAGKQPWTVEQAWAWYREQPWLCGFNYVPSSAINSTEMWQGETFDAETIERELGWAEEIGFTSCRIFLQYLVWRANPAGMLARLEQFLAIAARHKISTMVCLFDDCAFAGKQPYLGPQDVPAPGVHNSGWTPSPGHHMVVDKTSWPQLQEYVTSVISAFKEDQRIVVWDLYNEPGNEGMGEKSLSLLQETFQWARACRPIQPLTSCVWNLDLHTLNDAALALSDIVTFHHYGDLASLQQWVARLQTSGRPLVCTEWFSRVLGSNFSTHLPFFHAQHIGCYFWGLVNGKTQTHFPWGSAPGAAEPALWHHDLLRSDGSFYVLEEQQVIQNYLQQGK